MMRFRTIIAMTLLLFASFSLKAQNNLDQSAFGNTMRSNGRIYVVIAVMLTILAGIIIYLVRLDRKLTKLEK